MDTSSTDTFAELRRLSTIEKFIKDYAAEDYEHYVQLSKRACSLLNEKLKDERKKTGTKLKVHVTWRAKSPESLEEKLRKRDSEYVDRQAILKDVVDLAGVRIILYMPSEDQQRRAKELIYAIWGQNRVHTKIHYGTEKEVGELQHPDYKRTHLGYRAVHYRVTMKQQWQEEGVYTYKKEDLVEIQVVTAFTHVWAEARHDIQYKNRRFGRTTLEEEQLLDALSGIASSADLIFGQIDDSFKHRTYRRFRYMEDLRTFLRGLEELNDQSVNAEIFQGGLDILFRFLENVGENYPVAVRNRIIGLGYPGADLDAVMQRFVPNFKPEDSMKACICLIHHILHTASTGPDHGPKWHSLNQEKGEDKIWVGIGEAQQAKGSSDEGRGRITTARQLHTMIRALKLLQRFAGSDMAKSFLQKVVSVDTPERVALSWILIDINRESVLRGKGVDDKNYWRKVQGMIDLAWDWFIKQSSDKKSFCGFVFKLAEMKALEDKELHSFLDELNIGSLEQEP